MNYYRFYEEGNSARKFWLENNRRVEFGKARCVTTSAPASSNAP